MIIFCSLGITLDSAETPFAKTLFLVPEKNEFKKRLTVQHMQILVGTSAPKLPYLAPTPPHGYPPAAIAPPLCLLFTYPPSLYFQLGLGPTHLLGRHLPFPHPWIE